MAYLSRNMQGNVNHKILQHIYIYIVDRENVISWNYKFYIYIYIKVK